MMYIPVITLASHKVHISKKNEISYHVTTFVYKIIKLYSRVGKWVWEYCNLTILLLISSETLYERNPIAYIYILVTAGTIMTEYASNTLIYYSLPGLCLE